MPSHRMDAGDRGPALPVLGTRFLFDISVHYGVEKDNRTFLSGLCPMDPAIVASDAGVDEESADAVCRYDSPRPRFSKASPLWTIPVASQPSTPVLLHVG